MPSFYGTPLVAWQPALGADQYQVQWSKKSYPWVKVGEKFTYATSALLPLEPGLWYYRVRGVNFSLPGLRSRDVVVGSGRRQSRDTDLHGRQEERPLV